MGGVLVQPVQAFRRTSPSILPLGVNPYINPLPHTLIRYFLKGLCYQIVVGSNNLTKLVWGGTAYESLWMKKKVEGMCACRLFSTSIPLYLLLFFKNISSYLHTPFLPFTLGNTSHKRSIFLPSPSFAIEKKAPRTWDQILRMSTKKIW